MADNRLIDQPPQEVPTWQNRLLDWADRNAPEYLKESARSLYEGPRNRLLGLYDEFKDSRLSGQTAAGLGSTLDPVRMLPGANSGMLLDIPRTMYLSRFGTQELPAGTDVYKYSNAEDAAGQRFASENPETAQTIGASMEAQFSHPLGMGFVPHAVSRGTDRAGNALAEHTPGPDQVNMFAGPKAKTADLPKLEQAQSLESAGHSPDTIWKETGWFKGADGKWKFEIPDNEAKLAGVAKPGPGWSAEAQFTGLDHPGLEEAYGKFPGDFLGFYGGPSHPLYGEKISEAAYTPGAKSIDVSARDANDARSMTLHEKQHWLQDVEGFAQGSSVEDELARMPNLGWFDRTVLKRVSPLDYEKKLFQANDTAYDNYRRTAGETEARNVPLRDELLRKWLKENPGGDPKEWAAQNPPWKTQDVPNEQQIVRFGNGDGPQMSISGFHGSPFDLTEFDRPTFFTPSLGDAAAYRSRASRFGNSKNVYKVETKANPEDFKEVPPQWFDTIRNSHGLSYDDAFKKAIDSLSKEGFAGAKYRLNPSDKEYHYFAAPENLKITGKIGSVSGVFLGPPRLRSASFD